MDTNDVEKYNILPSTGSMIMEMMIVVTLFFGYILYISYLSAYGSGFKPNFVMFIDMIFDRNNDQRFQTYIQNIVKDTKKKDTENFEIKKKHSFFQTIQSHFFQFISKFYLTKNKIYISKKNTLFH